MGCGQLGVVEWTDTAEETDANAGEEPACVQQGWYARLSTDVEEASQDYPTAGDEHGVFSRDDLAQNTRGERAEETSELEDRCEPTGGRGRFDDCREALGEAVHYQTLAQDTLLISILESTETAGVSAIVSADAFGRRSLRSEECNEQDFGITLDRVPDVGLHIGGHGCEDEMNLRRNVSEDSVVVESMLRVRVLSWQARSSDRDVVGARKHFVRTGHGYIHISPEV